jgi:hypothetical protein
VASRSQWFTSRKQLSDWLTNAETEKRSAGSRHYATQAIAVHPLLLGLEEVCMGLQQLGRDSFMLSRFSSLDLSGDLTLDSLATEDFAPIVDEESGEELAI